MKRGIKAGIDQAFAELGIPRARKYYGSLSFKIGHWRIYIGFNWNKWSEKLRQWVKTYRAFGVQLFYRARREDYTDRFERLELWIPKRKK